MAKERSSKQNTSTSRTSSEGRKAASGGFTETPGRDIKDGGGRKQGTTSRGGGQSRPKKNT